MKFRVFLALLAGLCLTTGCNTDPNVAKRKYLERGNSYFEKGKYKEAMIMYLNALKKDPKYGEAYYRRALVSLKMDSSITGQLSAARDLQRTIEFMPDNMDAYDKLIDIYLHAYLLQGRPKSYINDLQTILDRLRKRNPHSYQVYRLSGYLALTEKKNADAMNFFQQANATKPLQPDVVLVMMQTYWQMGQNKEAEALAADMLKKDPKAAPVYSALFIHYMAEKRQEDADRILKSQIEHIPEVVDNHLQLAASYWMQGRRADMMQVLNTVLSDTKRWPDGHKRVGDFYLRIHMLDDALRVYKEGIAKQPNLKPDYQKAICEVLAQQGKFDEANATIAEVLKNDPKDNEAIGIRAGIMLAHPNKDTVQSAINDLQTVISRLPKERTAVVHYNLGRAYAMRDDLQQARIQFEEALSIRSDYLQPRIALNEIYLGRREFGRVLEYCNEVLRRDPTNVPARLQRTRALIGVQNLKDARDELTKLSTQFPRLWDAKLQLAALDALQNPKAAEGAYREIIANTADPRAVVGLADTLVRQNRIDDAMRVLREQEARDPGRSTWRIQIGSLAFRDKRFDQAAAEFMEVLKRDPRDGDTWIRLGETKKQAGDSPGAIQAFQKAAEVAPNNVTPLLTLAMLYDAQNRRDLSKPLYQKALRIEPENPVALNNLAYNLVENGTDLDQALAMAQRAHQRLPGNTDVSDTLGWVYLRKNLNDSAIQIFRESVRLQPQRALYRLHLGMALAAKGNKAEAKTELTNALRMSPSKDEENQIHDLLKKLG